MVVLIVDFQSVIPNHIEVRDKLMDKKNTDFNTTGQNILHYSYVFFVFQLVPDFNN